LFSIEKRKRRAIISKRILLYLLHVLKGGIKRILKCEVRGINMREYRELKNKKSDDLLSIADSFALFAV